MTIFFHKSFTKQAAKIPQNVYEAFKNRLKIFKVNKNYHLLNNHSVDAAYPGCRSINVTGDYRAVFREEGENIRFLYIGTHAQLYG